MDASDSGLDPLPSRRLTIAFLVRALDYGGAERQLVALARGLHRRGHRVAVLSFYGGGPLGDDLRADGVAVVDLGKRHRWDLVGPFRRLVAALGSIDPDILHGYLVDANIFAVLLARTVPRARIIWGVRASALDLDRYSTAVGMLFRVSRWLAGRADLIIANSARGAADHRAAGYPAGRLIVVPNGIDTAVFRPDRSSRDRVRATWGWPADAVIIGLVGRLDPMKGHVTFLRAAAVFARERPEARFVCIGDGPEGIRAPLQALGRTLGLEGRLQWLAAERHVAAMYNGLDVLTSASSFGEGFSNVIGEAMATGVPCVVTDVGDSAMIVGATGVVVRPDDPAALVEGWRTVLAARTGGAGPDPRQRVEAEFSIERLVSRTEEALVGVATRGTP